MSVGTSIQDQNHNVSTVITHSSQTYVNYSTSGKHIIASKLKLVYIRRNSSSQSWNFTFTSLLSTNVKTRNSKDPSYIFWMSIMPRSRTCGSFPSSFLHDKDCIYTHSEKATVCILLSQPTQRNGVMLDRSYVVPQMFDFKSQSRQRLLSYWFFPSPSRKILEK